jgi:hypothetical protein
MGDKLYLDIKKRGGRKAMTIRDLMKSRKLSWRALVGLGVGAAVVSVIVLVILNTVFWHPKVSYPKTTVLPNVPSQTLTPTELSRVVELFGPWGAGQVDEKNQVVSDPRNLLLLKENGGVRISLWGIRMGNEKWSSFIPPEIVSLTVEEGVVKLGTNKQRVFVVSVAQPFILEQTPLMVYLVSHERKVWGIPLSEAETLRYKVK